MEVEVKSSPKIVKLVPEQNTKRSTRSSSRTILSDEDKKELGRLKALVDQLQAELENSNDIEIGWLRSDISRLEQKNKELRELVVSRQKERQEILENISRLEKELAQIRSADFWKLAQAYYRIRDRLVLLKVPHRVVQKIKKLMNNP